MDNPIIWSFGKVEIKFQKASEPADMTLLYKNFQKEKMEPNYTEEPMDPKYVVSREFY